MKVKVKMSKLTDKEIIECKNFHEKAKIRLAKGEPPDSVYRDKPDGYSEWVKENYKETGGVRLPKKANIPVYECWKCGKIYQDTKCPYCGAFKPKK